MTKGGGSRQRRADGFVGIRRGFGNLDVYVHRKRIARALMSVRSDLGGTLLDVGCGLQPYRGLLTEPPSRVTRYVGVDLPGEYLASADVCWDGRRLPLADGSVDCALATEVLEHCSEPTHMVREIGRVLRPRGLLTVTVPFLWPLHCVPNDECRYTPFALRRVLETGGFEMTELGALGGWDASLAQMLGLWVRRRLRVSRRGRLARALLSTALAPVVWGLERWDARSTPSFEEGAMITGIIARARRAVAEGR